MEIRFVDNMWHIQVPHPFDSFKFRHQLEKVRLSFNDGEKANIAVMSHKTDKNMVIQILMDVLGCTNLIINIFEYGREA